MDILGLAMRTIVGSFRGYCMPDFTQVVRDLVLDTEVRYVDNNGTDSASMEREDCGRTGFIVEQMDR